MRKARIVDLSLPIMNGGGFGSPAKLRYIDHASRGQLMAERQGVDVAELGHRANASEEFGFLTTHTGTHFDAPWHYTATVQGEPAPTIDQIPLDRCWGSGVWLDLAHKAAGEDITSEDLETACRDIRYTIKPMDIVLLRTGASAHYGLPNCDNLNPGVTREGTLWLADQGVKVVGIDAGCWDRPPQLQFESLRRGARKGMYMQGHRAAGERGMCILEWLTNLEVLPHAGFTVFAFPVKIERASGAWARVVAMVEEE